MAIGIDLDINLDNFDTSASTINGKPLMLLLTDIEEDENQPRKDFDDDLDFVENIKTRGVKSPISVRSHPTKKGKWIF